MIIKMVNECKQGPAMFAGGSKSLFIALLALMMISGCTGLQTFSHTAYPGDTVALAIHRQDIKDKDATIVITDSTSFEQSFPGDDPQVKGWVNMYPDPVSRLIVGRETSQDLNVGARAQGFGIENQTGLEKDWYETIVFLDLPANLSAGVATVDVQFPVGTSILAQPVSVNILSGTGSPHPFEINEQAGPLTDDQFNLMERGRHFTITLSGGATVPEAVQIDFTHDPDVENGGTGQAYVVHPRGDIKNVSWTDDGLNLRVILTPSWQKSAVDISAEWLNSGRLEWFKFYVTGNIHGLQLSSITAYDINGDTVPGITANIQ